MRLTFNSSEAKRGDSYPYDISFMGRKVKVHDLDLHPENSCKMVIHYDMISGTEFNDDELSLFLEYFFKHHGF
jgi:hypothetical protein